MENVLNVDLKKYLDEKFDNMNKKFNYLEENVTKIHSKYENKKLKDTVNRKDHNGRS